MDQFGCPKTSCLCTLQPLKSLIGHFLLSQVSSLERFHSAVIQSPTTWECTCYKLPGARVQGTKLPGALVQETLFTRTSSLPSMQPSGHETKQATAGFVNKRAQTTNHPLAMHETQSIQIHNTRHVAGCRLPVHTIQNECCHCWLYVFTRLHAWYVRICQPSQ